MDKSEYTGWALQTWDGRSFIERSVAKGVETILTRLWTADAQVKAKSYGAFGWQLLPYTTSVDTLVPTISWLIIVVDEPMLVTVKQAEGAALRLLLKPDAAIATNDEGHVLPSSGQMNYMMTERIKELVGCDNIQASALRKRVRDKWVLQIFEFARYLLDHCDYKLHEAKQTLDMLWGCSPDQFCSIVPVRFHVLAQAERLHRLKIKANLETCLDLMASWKP